MKKVSFYSFLAAAILFTGCSQKNIEIDGNTPSANNTQSSNQINSSDDKLNQIDSNNYVENDNALNSNTDTVEARDLVIDSSNPEGTLVSINGEKVVINTIYFGFDKFNLSEEMRRTAKENAEKLAAINANTKIKIEGNCDEWGSDEYNYALGLKRAKTVKDVLVNNGVNANISLVSYGESKPVCGEKTKECWQENRRVNHTLAK